jgi:hypothetical protein
VNATTAPVVPPKAGNASGTVGPAAASPSVGELIAEARKAVDDGRPGDAKARLLSAAKLDPKNRDVRKLQLEVSYLTKDWTQGAALLEQLEPFSDGEEPSMFYAAVSLYESGNRESSRVLMKRARPRIVSSPFVDLYTKKILGTP